MQIPDTKRMFGSLQISSTGFEHKTRKDIENIITANGGELYGQFKKGMDVLVAKQAGSSKYIAAKKWDIPVVKPEWLRACVSAGKIVPTQGFLLGPFGGLNISVTGFQDPSSEMPREDIIKLIKDNDGLFCGSMTRNLTTHLVADMFEGSKKCEVALKWGDVHIVSLEWVTECAKRGYWIPEGNFIVKPQATKTRADHARNMILEQKQLREAQLAKQQQREREEKKKLETQMEQEKMHFDKVKASGMMLEELEDFNIYLHGFNRQRWRVVSFLVQCTGATVYWEWNENVTHIILGEKCNNEYVKYLTDSTPGLVTLNMPYILKCLTTGQRPHAKRKPPPDLSPQASKMKRIKTANANGGGSKAQLGDSTVEQGGAPEKSEKPDMSKILVCVSRYTGAERQQVDSITRSIGATFTDRLTRKNPRVTILISKDREGQKCDRAETWGIPIRNLEWLRSESQKPRPHLLLALALKPDRS